MDCYKARPENFTKGLREWSGFRDNKKMAYKKAPLVHCTEGAYLTSLEVGDAVPAILMTKPMHRWTGDWAHSIYTEESRQLSFSIKYSKILINNKDIVTSCIPTGQVHQQVVGGAFISSFFFTMESYSQLHTSIILLQLAVICGMMTTVMIIMVYR